MLVDESLQAALDDAVENHEWEFEKYFLAQFCKLRFEYEEGACLVRMQVQPWMLNTRRKLHGGVISLILDISMGHLLNREIQPGITIETKVQYLSACEGGDVVAKATFLKRGRQIQALKADLFNDNGRLVAFATATWATA